MMNRYLNDHRTTDGKSPTSVYLLRNPLDFLAEDHLRLRFMCAEMDALATSDHPGQDALQALLEYLEQDLPLLLADKDEDLLPRVLARAEPEDELPKLVHRLSLEHAQITRHLANVVAGLARMCPGAELPSQLARALQDLAHTTRRHLILENAVLMPLSRARLTAQDLKAIRSAMMSRRGLKELFSE